VQSLPTGGVPWIEDAIWSGTDPRIIYCHRDMIIYAYDIINNKYIMPIANLSSRLPGIANLQQMSKSLDDDTFAFNTQNSNFTRLGCLVYKKSTNSIIFSYTGTVDEVQLDKAGKFLIIMTGQQGKGVIEAYIVNLADPTMKLIPLTDNRPDLAPGHKDCGYDLVVGEDNWENTINARKMSDPHNFIPIISFGNDWSQGKHISLLTDDQSYALVSCFVANGLTSTGLFKNELFLVSTDGQSLVKRICHHHSTLAGQYWNSPRADISRDGKFVAFTSNWGDSKRRDVFIVSLEDSPIIPPPVQDKTFKLVDKVGKLIGEGFLY